MNARYSVLPRADRDLDDQAVYFLEESGIELGMRFLAAAHETFARLASRPRMGLEVSASTSGFRFYARLSRERLRKGSYLLPARPRLHRNHPRCPRSPGLGSTL